MSSPKMKLSIRKYLPIFYNTRYSYVFSLYGTLVDLKKLKSNIIFEGALRQIFVSESPHYLCAIECLNNTETLKMMLRLDRNRTIDYIKTHNLIYTKKYINYIEDSHPETDAIETLVDFLTLMNIFSTRSSANKSEISVLVNRRKDASGNRYWLLIDGLHRSSILLALNEVAINARVRFP